MSYIGINVEPYLIDQFFAKLDLNANGWIHYIVYHYFFREYFGMTNNRCFIGLT